MRWMYIIIRNSFQSLILQPKDSASSYFRFLFFSILLFTIELCVSFSLLISETLQLALHIELLNP